MVCTVLCNHSIWTQLVGGQTTCLLIMKWVQWPPWVRCHLVSYAQHHLGQLSFFDLSQVANQPLNQPPHNLCLTLCLVHICKTIHDRACHSGVHHLVPSRQDSLQSGVQVVTNTCSVEGVWLCCQNNYTWHCNCFEQVTQLILKWCRTFWPDGVCQLQYRFCMVLKRPAPFAYKLCTLLKAISMSCLLQHSYEPLSYHNCTCM